jgi:hypothetical protein
VPIAWLQKDRGGTLRHSVARRIDAATTPTVTLVRKGGEVLVASQAATKGPRTTLDAAAAAGQTTIPLTATTNVAVGKVYRLTNAAGQHEFVTVDSIASGVSVTSRRPLAYTYAAADVFESHELSVSVTGAQADAVRSNCRARWLFTSDGQEHLEESLFHVSSFAPIHTVTPEDVGRRYPRIYDALASSQVLAELIDEIWTNEVLEDLAGRVDDEHGLVAGSGLNRALLLRVVAQVEGANEQWDDFDRYMELYRTALEQAVALVPIDTDDDGDVDEGDEPPLHPWVFKVDRG